jgi:hypothetical protein
MPGEIVTQRARADHLLSKLIAGGLSAGVVLLWWPHVVTHDSAVSWVARGIAWTLLAEILILALSPVELVLRSRLAPLAPAGLVRRAGARSQQLSYVVLAAVAICLPLTLLVAGKPATPVQTKRVTKVTRVVKVVKPVQVKRIVIRRTVRAAAPYVPPVVTTPRPTATWRPAATPAPRHQPTTRAHTKGPASKGGSQPQHSATPRPEAPPSKGDAGNQAATTPAPAAKPVTTPAPGS